MATKAQGGCVKCKQEQAQSTETAERSGVHSGECGASYSEVERCMAENKGQIRECVSEWDAFRKCRESVGPN